MQATHDVRDIYFDPNPGNKTTKQQVLDTMFVPPVMKALMLERLCKRHMVSGTHTSTQIRDTKQRNNLQQV